MGVLLCSPFVVLNVLSPDKEVIGMSEPPTPFLLSIADY